MYVLGFFKHTRNMRAFFMKNFKKIICALKCLFGLAFILKE